MLLRRTWLWVSGCVIAMAILAPSPALLAAPDISVIVHPSNTTTALSVHELEAIFTSSRRRWSDGQSIVAFHYEPNDPLRIPFDKAVLGMEPQEVARFWIDQRIRGLPGPPRRINNAQLLVRVVERMPAAIGYVWAKDVDKANVKVVATIRNGRVIAPAVAGGAK